MMDREFRTNLSCTIRATIWFGAFGNLRWKNLHPQTSRPEVARAAAIDDRHRGFSHDAG